MKDDVMTEEQLKGIVAGMSVAYPVAAGVMWTKLVVKSARKDSAKNILKIAK